MNGTQRRRDRRRMQQRIRDVVADRRLSLALADLTADPPSGAAPEAPVQPPPVQATPLAS